MINIIYSKNTKDRTILGVYNQKNNDFGVVIPLDKSLNSLIILSKNNINDIKDKDFVLCEKIKDTNKGRVINKVNENEIHKYIIDEIISSYNISQYFNENIKLELDNIKNEISNINMENRKDLRHRRIITIDGENTKDFDDAISIEVLSNGNYLLGVHIADVCEYVKEGLTIDNEAIKRGTSIYLIDRTIPMLPEELSNNLCSLQPNSDRFCLTCDMEINKFGSVVNSNIYQSLINTYARLTYDEVNKIINKKNNTCDKYLDLLEDIYLYKNLKDILKSKRNINGLLRFDNKEKEILLNEFNLPYSIKFKECGFSNELIEEFMILCNETISNFCVDRNIPLLYRIHEKPTLESINTLYSSLNVLDYKFNTENFNICELQKLLDYYKDKSEYYFVDTNIKKCLSKAIYSTIQNKHFGLGIDNYTHFTSPIRRYPDLINHRILKDYINNNLTLERINHYKDILHNICMQSNYSESIATKCEYEVEKYFLLLYLKNKNKSIYNATVSLLIEKGIIINFNNFYQTFVPYYKLNKEYKIGDKIDIKINSIDINYNKIIVDVI